MPNELHKRLEALVAAIGFNDGANKGFWRIQPRQRFGRDKGQWIPMGAELRMFYKNQRGQIESVTGRAVGSTGSPDGVRVLVQGQGEKGVPDAIYGASTSQVQIAEAILSEEFLKEQGIENTPKLTAEQAAAIPTLESLERTDITDEDIRLINEGINSPEGKEQEAFKDTPEGKAVEALEPVDTGKPASNSNYEKRMVERALTATDKMSNEKLKERISKLFGQLDPKNSDVEKENAKKAVIRALSDRVRERGEPNYSPQQAEVDRIMKNVDPIEEPAPQRMADSEPAKDNLSELDAEVRAAADAAGRALQLGSEQEQVDAVKAYREAVEKRDKADNYAASAVEEVLADVAFGGDTDKTVDDVLSEVKAAKETGTAPRLRQIEGDEEAPRKTVVPAALEPGDVIRASDGSEQTVIDISNARDANGELKILVRLQAANGEVYSRAVSSEMRVKVWGPKRRLQRVPAPAQREDQPQRTPAAPEAPAAETPETPETPQPEEDFEDAQEVPVETTTPANFPPSDRIDDGSEFDISPLSESERRALRAKKLDPVLDENGVPALFLDENNELKPAEDPFEIMNVLAQSRPSAKFTPDGKALILHRQKDKDGRIFEVRAFNTGKKAIGYSIRWTDPNTGEVEELQYKNDAHSISAALGKYDADYLLDRLLGRKPEHELLTFGRGDTPATRATMDDSLRKRAEIAFMGSKDASNSRRKLVTLRENALRLALGRNAVLHNNGTIHQSEIDSLWDGFDAFVEDRSDASKEDVYHMLYSIFGNAPLDEKSHAVYMSALREEFTRRYKGKISNKDTRSFHGLLTSASERMRGIYRGDSPKTRSIKYASKDRTRPVEVGMTVEYVNNVGDKSIVKVSRLVKGTGARSQAGDVYDFGDYVIIQDSDGTVRKINALKLRILNDQATPLTKYIPNLQNEALRTRRAEQGLFVAPAPVERIPGQGFVLSRQPQGPVFVDDLTAGDILPSKEGKPIGEIIAVKPITSKNGTPGYAFLVRKPDGEEVRVNYAQGTELELKKA